MSRKKVKGKTLDLNSFLSEGGGTVQAGFTVVQKRNLDWSAEDDIVAGGGFVEMGQALILPTAPMSSRGGLVDEAKVPNRPPYTAFLGNLPFEVTEEEVANFLADLKIDKIRLTYDSSERFRGFGYVDFEDRASLIAALNLDGEMLRTRAVKISLPEDDDHQRLGPGGRRDGGFGGRPMERELPSDWRAAARDEPPPMRNSGGGFDRYGDRDLNRDWRSGGSDRNGGRGGGGGFNRYEPPSRSSDSGPTERPRLNLAPRTKPIEPIQVTQDTEEQKKSPEPERPKVAKPKAADIFGAAKPVDTAAREREIEKRLDERAKKAREEAEKEREEREKERMNNNNNESNNSGEAKRATADAVTPSLSWRQPSREEKEKREREKKARSERRVPAVRQEDDAPVVTTSRNKFADLDEGEEHDPDAVQQSEEEK